MRQADSREKPAPKITKKAKGDLRKNKFRQKTPEEDNSFENIQPQSLAKAAEIPLTIPFED